MNIKKFKKLPIIGILRGIKPKVVSRLTEAIISSGLRTIEITMNTQGAANLIKTFRKESKEKLTIGAGTVLSLDDLKKAKDNGASFIVTPTIVDEVIEHCLKNNICIFTGALTPNEIYLAEKMGSTMVKVFPAKFFGPDYFKEIKGPFSNIELLACGGVNADNIKAFFTCGASGVAFGGSIFNKEWLARGDFFRIEECIKKLISNYKELSLSR